MEKKEIRKEIFQKRAQLTPEIIHTGSHEICQKIIQSEDFQKAPCIYVYMDYNGEVSTRELIEEAWKQKKRVAAPKVNGADIDYYYIHSYEDVAPGYFHIPEPITTEQAFEENALVIVPGVAFDSKCHRCGYGKGFYDRYLSLHTKHRTIAVAFDFQVVDAVPSDAHDILPQMLITPAASYFAQ
ncbi:5-formyltetrahydrofolate cyclo-ligase [uncultured Robinsoniella sp.]|uniref:5-formyltetrahydrofolate cyclo-ligase n=1 Tax=uncultured Robinsoniella sp. TaxID=904190 RepID=UPI00374F08CF